MHNICHINIIFLQDIIPKTKILDKNKQKKQLIMNTFNAKIAYIYHKTKILLKYSN